MNKKFFEISSNIIYVEYYLELLDLKIFFHRVYVEKMKKEMKCLSSNVGLFLFTIIDFCQDWRCSFSGTCYVLLS